MEVEFGESLSNFIIGDIQLIDGDIRLLRDGTEWEEISDVVEACCRSSDIYFVEKINPDDKKFDKDTNIQTGVFIAKSEQDALLDCYEEFGPDEAVYNEKKIYVQEQLVNGTPYTYRFRVPKEGSLKINDLIRGESDSVIKVRWNLDTLGDFVIMISNGQPVYNFCVTVDDATMAISHVIRAEEHLPNTLRQTLIYKCAEVVMLLQLPLLVVVLLSCFCCSARGEEVQGGGEEYQFEYTD
ncbi:hypothetical protein ACFE04_020363 [Oxalis oulophora]